MAQMETFMKDLTDLNSAIESTLIPANFDLVQKYLATQASMTTALNGLPAEYARAYLQVQTLKYDENNDPVDVTAKEALSVPDSVISRYKQSWGNLNNTLESIKNRLDQVEMKKAALVPEGRQVIEFTTGSTYYGFIKTSAQYSDASDIFSDGGESYVLFNLISNITTQLPDINNVDDIAGTLFQAVAMIAPSMAAFTLDSNRAKKILAPFGMSVRKNLDNSFKMWLYARGRVFSTGFKTFSTGSGSLAANMTALYSNYMTKASAWSEVSGGTDPTDICTGWTAPSSARSINLQTPVDTQFVAEAPGGLITETVDRVPLDIDLSALDGALSAL